MVEWLLLSIATLLLIAANGFFVASEFAIISVSRPRLETLSAEGSSVARRVLGIVSSPASRDLYIATSQLGLSLASLGLGMYAEHRLVSLLVPYVARLTGGLGGASTLAAAHSLTGVLVLALLTFWHIVLGEMVPKSIALAHAEKTAFALALPTQLLQIVLYPLVWVLHGIGRLALQLLRLPTSAEGSLIYSHEELAHILEDSHEGGLLEGEEHRLLQKVMTFGQRTVRQVMVARTLTVGLPVTSTVKQALQQVAVEGYTRYPVYERDMDHIVGMVHVKDLLRSRQRGDAEVCVRELLRAVPFVPETMMTSELFSKMQAERIQFAVVVEEHGGTAGIVTMEDLVEEIFGEVRDEFDQEEVEPMRAQNDGSWLVQGTVPLADLEEALDRELDFDEVDTVSGLVMDLLGRPPRVGDRVQEQGLKVVVLAVRDLSVALARVEAVEVPVEGEPDEIDST
jgi:CBS domain containing-hemolysin-like protein